MQNPNFTSITGVTDYVAGITSDTELSNELLITTGHAIGAFGASIQAIATWANFNPDSTLNINAGDVHRYIQGAFENDLLLVAASLARKIQAPRQGTDIYFHALKSVRDELVRRHTQKYFKHSNCHIICVRHPYLPKPPATRIDFDLNPAFFKLKEDTLVESLRGLNEPESALYRLFRFGFVSLGIDRAFLDGGIFYRILRALFELFENANIWGLAPLPGVNLSHNVRGIYARYHSARGTQTYDSFADPPIAAYLHQLKSRFSTNLRGFLELTVYDCGPGLAAMKAGSALPDNTSVDREYQLLKDCLRLRGSTRDSLNRGKGLHIVFSELNTLHAFIFIRSGRLSLFRSFLKHPFAEPPDSNYDMEPFFASDALSPSPTRVTGALFVIVIPIIDAKNEQSTFAL